MTDTITYLKRVRARVQFDHAVTVEANGRRYTGRTLEHATALAFADDPMHDTIQCEPPTTTIHIMHMDPTESDAWRSGDSTTRARIVVSLGYSVAKRRAQAAGCMQWQLATVDGTVVAGGVA